MLHDGTAQGDRERFRSRGDQGCSRSPGRRTVLTVASGAGQVRPPRSSNVLQVEPLPELPHEVIITMSSPPSSPDDGHPEVPCVARGCVEHAVATRPFGRLRDHALVGPDFTANGGTDDSPVPLCLEHFRQQLG